MVFDLSKGAANQPKVYVAHGLLPDHINFDELPTSKQPFAAILDQHWSHTVDVLLPRALYDAAWPQIEKKMGNYEYSKVFMSLSQLLEGDFFNVYIKSGNISMLSEGRAHLDCLYSLRQGVLRLELPKEKYERAGLVGKAIPDGGRTHIKTRYAVDIYLREPSMVRGKKGFERVLWACKNVLDESLTWLFFDHCASKTLESGSIPIALHHPVRKNVVASVKEHQKVLIPPLDGAVQSGDIDEEYSMETLEWLGLVAIGSPRTSVDDKIDSFLSRYQVPSREDATKGDLVSLRWHGFINSIWARQLFAECQVASRGRDEAWFALTARAFRTQAMNPNDGYTILRIPSVAGSGDGTGQSSKLARPEYLLWRMADTVNHR